jgi:hypothetical protein
MKQFFSNKKMCKYSQRKIIDINTLLPENSPEKIEKYQE